MTTAKYVGLVSAIAFLGVTVVGAGMAAFGLAGHDQGERWNDLVMEEMHLKYQEIMAKKERVASIRSELKLD